MTAEAALQQSRALSTQGKPAEAARQLQAWLAHPPPGLSEGDLTILYLEASRDAASGGDGPAARRLLAEVERRSPSLATYPVPLANLRREQARVYVGLGDFRAAIPLLSASARGLADTAPRAAAEATNEMGSAYLELREADLAATAFRQTISLLKNLPDEPRPRVAALVNLANAEVLARAIPEAMQAATDAEREAGNDPDLQRIALTARAEVMLEDSDITAAETLLKRLASQPVHSGDPTAGHSLFLLARAQYERGLLPEADEVAQRALPLYVAAMGQSHPGVARLLHLMGLIRDRLGDLDVALALLARDAAITEAVAGPNSIGRAATRIDFAQTELDAGRISDARRDAAAALAVLEGAPKPDWVLVAWAHVVLGAVAQKDGDPAAAERQFGLAQPDLRQAGRPALGTLAYLGLLNGRALVSLGRLDEAQAALREAETLYGQLGAGSSTRAAEVISTMADIREKKGDRRGALEESHRSYALLYDQLVRGSEIPDERADFRQQSTRDLLIKHAARLIALDPDTPAGQDEAFAAVQLAQRSRASDAIRFASSRLALGSDALAGLIRRRSDQAGAIRQAELLARSNLETNGARAEAAAEQFRRRAEAARQSLAVTDAEIRQRFPRFADFTGIVTTKLTELQATLRPGEALLMPVLGDQKLLLWVVTPDAHQVLEVGISATEITAAVHGIRASVDLNSVNEGQPLPLFNKVAAHRLYNALIRPADNLLRTIQTLIFVPDGPLQTIPLSFLLGDSDDSWLARRFAVENIPTVAAFVQQRSFSRTRSAPSSFLGVGNPILGPRPADVKRSSVGAPVQMGLRQALLHLPSLPETADELRRMATEFEPLHTRLMLGQDAAPTKFMAADLAQVSTIAFASHAIMAGELPELSEPAIVLTAISDDPADGLLTGSQIATLRLSADLVILSACNTASPDGGPFSDGFSGLTRSFLYAGARSLLVSHWAVNSLATVKLTTSFLSRLHRTAGLSKAAALQGAMLDMLNEPNANLHHPALWSAFVILGE